MLTSGTFDYEDCCEEDLALLMAAEKSFGEWENNEDRVYDILLNCPRNRSISSDQKIRLSKFIGLAAAGKGT